MVLTTLVFAALARSQQVPAGIRYKKAPVAVNKKAAEKLHTLFTSPRGKADLSDISGQVVVCGPGLWMSMKPVAPKVMQDALKIDCHIPSPSGMMEAEARAFRTPEQKEAFWKLLLGRFGNNPAITGIRNANADELKYYWAWIPYDIDEPLLIAEFGTDAKLLFDFDDDAKDPKVFTVDTVGSITN